MARKMTKKIEVTDSNIWDELSKNDIKKLSILLYSYIVFEISVDENIRISEVKQSSIAKKLDISPSLLSQCKNSENDRSFSKDTFEKYALNKGINMFSLISILDSMANPDSINDLGQELPKYNKRFSPDDFTVEPTRGTQNLSYVKQEFKLCVDHDEDSHSSLLTRLRNAYESEDQVELFSSFMKMVTHWRFDNTQSNALQNNVTANRKRKLTRKRSSLINIMRLKLISFMRESEKYLMSLNPPPETVLLVFEFGQTISIVRLDMDPGTGGKPFTERFQRLSHFTVHRNNRLVEDSIKRAWSGIKNNEMTSFQSYQTDEFYNEILNKSDRFGRLKTLVSVPCFSDLDIFFKDEGGMRITAIFDFPGAVSKRPLLESSLFIFGDTIAHVFSRDSNVAVNDFVATMAGQNVSHADILPHHELQAENPRVFKDIADSYKLVMNKVYDDLDDNSKFYTAELWLYDFDSNKFVQTSADFNSYFSCENSDEYYGISMACIANHKSYVKKRNPPALGGKTHFVLRSRQPVVLQPEEGQTITPDYPSLDLGSYIQIPIVIRDRVLGRRLYGTVAFRFVNVLQSPMSSFLPRLVRTINSVSPSFRANVCNHAANSVKPESGSGKNSQEYISLGHSFAEKV